MSLDDDITRIAAQRGRPAANYQQEARALQTAERRVTAAEIRALFRVPSNFYHEMAAFDALPPKSRAALDDLPVCPSALKYADLLIRCNDEDGLISVIRRMMGEIVQDWLMRHYGRRHPNVRRLG